MENCEIVLSNILIELQNILLELKKISGALGVPQ